MKRALLQDLIQWKESKHRKPLLLRGARQVGKTWLLKEFGKTSFSAVHYLNFERDDTLKTIFTGSLAPLHILEQYELLKDVTIDKEKDLIIFDEIQEEPRALTSLKYFSEEMSNLAVCAAGSHIGITRSAGSFPVGKVDDMILYPFSFSEFLTATYLPLAEFLENKTDFIPLPEAIHYTLYHKFLIYYAVGGLPEAIKTFIEEEGDIKTKTEESRLIHKKLLFNYMSDFSKHAGKVNASHINTIFGYIPHYLSKTVDGSINRFHFKGVLTGKSRFADLEAPIEWLVHTGLLYKTSVIESCKIPLKQFEKENIFKLTLFDIGILHSMLNIPVGSILLQNYGAFKGYLAENYVAHTLHALGFTNLHSWRGRQSEIEFIIQANDLLIPIEVKSGTRVRAKSLAVFTKKYNPKLKIIISANNLSLSENNTLYIPIYMLDKLHFFIDSFTKNF